jgi:type I restriction-modification system DNA methylase subunit
LSETDCQEILKATRDGIYDQPSILVRRVDYGEIAANDFSLLPGRYLSQVAQTQRRPLSERVNELQEMQSEYDRLAQQTDELIRNFLNARP